MSDLILVKNIDQICQILFNRPEKKNAITAEMYQLMANAINNASANSAIKVILLASNNEHFTAGNDLSDFLANPSIEKGSPVHEFLQALMHCPLPVIAAVQGFAIGIGSTLLLHCEQVFADETSIFSFPFINLGLVPEAGSSLLLPRLIGYQKAADLLLSGKSFSAPEALEIGFISRLVSLNKVNQAAMDYAISLCEKPRSGLIEVKQLLKRNSETLQERADIELESFVQCLNSPAAKEAMTAFLEKRLPNFSNL